PGRLPRRAAARRRLEAVGTPRDLARPRRARVPGDEPVHARPPAPGVVGRLARPAARPRRLARLRARLVGALLVHREALVGAGAGARDLRRRPRPRTETPEQN